MDYKKESPLMMKGEYGDGELVRKEIKYVGTNHTMCSLNLSPGY